MLPSEKLRFAISKIYGLDLEKYSWTDKLKEFLLSIPLDKFFETSLDTLKEAYSYGLNIGHCGLTSRYFIRGMENANLYYGTLSILAGTKNSPTGEHAWIVYDGMIIDPTLMICVPLDEAKKIGYVTQKIIAKGCDKILSEYDTYENELYCMQNQPDFQDSLLDFKRN